MVVASLVILKAELAGKKGALRSGEIDAGAVEAQAFEAGSRGIRDAATIRRLTCQVEREARNIITADKSIPVSRLGFVIRKRL